MEKVEDALRRTVTEAAPRLRALTDAQAAARPAPGKWSPREVLGHLIDSASNNHGRFVRAQLTDDFVFPGYAQDVWVRLQRYQDAPWPELVELWRLLNLQVVRVIAAMPESVRTKPRARHNLHEIAWKTVPESEPTTLEYFLRDYVGHLEHHLAQIPGVAGLAGGRS